ncbi:MAG: hypothetical protein IKQ49_08310 [Eubacterium sp.]|nr:hypothetical protein [Eubacterium sp.]
MKDGFMNGVTDEMMEKAKAAASAEELLKLAEEAGVEMTEESAKEAFSRLHPSEKLSIDDLDDVAGGCTEKHEKCKYCGSTQTRCLGSETKTGNTVYSMYCYACERNYSYVYRNQGGGYYL